jgi:hypothetical protein
MMFLGDAERGGSKMSTRMSALQKVGALLHVAVPMTFLLICAVGAGPSLYAAFSRRADSKLCKDQIRPATGGRPARCGSTIGFTAVAEASTVRRFFDVAENEALIEEIIERANRPEAQRGNHRTKNMLVRVDAIAHQTTRNREDFVKPSVRFGTIVMEAMAERSVDGAVDLGYASSGVTWRLSCPAANALEPWDVS